VSVPFSLIRVHAFPWSKRSGEACRGLVSGRQKPPIFRLEQAIFFSNPSSPLTLVVSFEYLGRKNAAIFSQTHTPLQPLGFVWALSVSGSPKPVRVGPRLSSGRAAFPLSGIDLQPATPLYF